GHVGLAVVEPAERPRVTRRGGDPDLTQLREYAIGVQHGLLHALGGEEASRSLEEALALEVEAPRGRLRDVGGAETAQVQELLHELALEDGKVGVVPVREVRVVVEAPVGGYRGVAF